MKEAEEFFDLLEISVAKLKQELAKESPSQYKLLGDIDRIIAYATFIEGALEDGKTIN